MRMRATSPSLDVSGAHATQPQKSGRAATLLALLGALTLILSACNIGGGAAAGPDALAPDQTFTWPYVDASGIMGHNTVLDPALITTAKDYAMVTMIYTNLVTFSPNLGIAPDAATHWDVDSTGTIYTFHLRPNLKFSDGAPITANDFAYSIARALQPSVQPTDPLCAQNSATYTPLGECSSVAGTHLGNILGTENGQRPPNISQGDNAKAGLNVIDQLTLRIRLTSAASYFLEALTYPTADVVEQSLIKKYSTGLWVDHLDTAGCSGPLMIKSYGSGKVMTLVPNPAWEAAFGKKLTLKQIVRPLVLTTQDEYNSYRAGQYDFTDVSLDQYQFARGQDDFHDVVALETDYFGLNFKLAPFDNKQVRQAFALALNKQFLVDGLEKGGAVPTNHVVPQGMPGYFPDLLNPALDGTQSLTGNSSAASTLLNKAQSNCSSDPTVSQPDYCPYIFGSSPKEIDLYAPLDDATRIAIASTAAQMWNQSLNVNVKVKPVTFGALVENLNPSANPMSIWEIGWIADYPDPQDWLSIQFRTGAFFNAGNMSDSAFDKLVDAADGEHNPAKRMQEYNQAEQIVINDVGWIPFQQAKAAWRVRPYVRGFTYNGMGMMVDLSWANVYIAAH
jgi:oligopeptide transport system substrate-binding protein